MAIVEIPSFNELYALAKAQALLDTNKLSDLSWSDGYMMDILTGMPSALAEEVARIAVELNTKHYVSQAELADLDTLALDHFGLVRDPGDKAVGSARFYRATTAAGNVTIAADTIVETADGEQFRTVGGALLTGLEIDVTIEAVNRGLAGIVAVDTIVAINATTSLSDTTVQVRNPLVTSGGLEVETDPAFRARILAWFATLRRGTVLALETGAKWITGVVTATVDESSYPPTVYIADSVGEASTALENLVRDELENWRAAGVAVNVIGATVVTQDVDVSLTFSTGFDTSDVRDKVGEAITAAIATLGIGATLYTSLIVAAALSVDGIVDCTVSDPAGDVVPAVNELIRIGTLAFV